MGQRQKKTATQKQTIQQKLLPFRHQILCHMYYYDKIRKMNVEMKITLKKRVININKL